jgi:hypothetical protein
LACLVLDRIGDINFIHLQIKITLAHPAIELKN